MRICIHSRVLRPTLAHLLMGQRRKAAFGCAISVTSHHLIGSNCDGAVLEARLLPADASWMASVKSLRNARTIRNSSDCARTAQPTLQYPSVPIPVQCGQA